MLLTDEEARKEDCPFFRYVFNEHQVFHDGQSAVHYHRQCQGSDCKIAWRWDPSSADTDPITGHEFKSNKGFCGIVGRPIAN